MRDAKIIPFAKGKAMLRSDFDGQVYYETPSWCASPSRVASRYREALVVPPRRDREIAMYQTFLKSLKADLAAVKAAEPLLDKAEDALWGAGINDALPYWEADKYVRILERDLGSRKDIPIALMEQEDYQDRKLTRQNVQWALSDMQRALKRTRTWAEQLEKGVQTQDFTDEIVYSDLTPAEIRAVKALPATLKRIPDSVDLLLKRMKRIADPGRDDIPLSAEVRDLETLYHASVNAKQLAQSGFSSTMPEQSGSAGLGGSQSAGGGKAGISFTEDAYVAKEIARVLKEVAMIARGEVKGHQVLDWAARSGRLSQIIDWFALNYANLDRQERLVVDGKKVRAERFGLNEQHLADVKAGRAEYDPKLSSSWSEFPLHEVIGNPVGAMGLYLSYLNFSGRYDPKFFQVGGPPGLVRRFKGLNPRNIGYITATVDMSDPHITYGKGEREFRVPPEAVVSVDRFIS